MAWRWACVLAVSSLRLATPLTSLSWGSRPGCSTYTRRVVGRRTGTGLGRVVLRRAEDDPETPSGGVETEDGDVDMDALRKNRLDEEMAAYDDRADELNDLRARIKAMAAEQDLEESAEGWVPEMMSQQKQDANSPPEMTAAMTKIAEFLGDDRVDDDEGPADPDDVYDDPLAGMPAYLALFEEAKTIEWPTPDKVIRGIGLTYGVIAGLSLFILGCDKGLVFVGKQFFTYGVNTYIVK